MGTTIEYYFEEQRNVLCVRYIDGFVFKKKTLIAIFEGMKMQ